MPPMPGEGLLGPGRDHLLRVGEALAASRTASAGRTRTGASPRRGRAARAPPRSPRRRRSRAAARGRRRRRTACVSPASRDLRALGPEQLLRGLDARRVELGRRRARRRCCRRRAPAASRRCAGPAITVTSAARPSAAAISRELALQAHRANSSTNTSISPPHGSPTSQASLSAIPKWSSRGSSRAQHLGGGLDDGALDAAAGDGAGHLAVLVHGHLRAGRARRRALHAHHGRDRDPVAPIEPRPHVVEHVLHPSPPSISSAKCANDEIEFPDRKWSTCGSAACMPRVSGS